MDTRAIDGKMVEDFITKHGRRASLVMSVLGKMQPFQDAVKSELGVELLSDAASYMDKTLPKIIDQTADARELAKFTAYRDIAERWAGKIAHYERERQKVLDNKI